MTMNQLLKTPLSKRHSDWEQSFLRAFTESDLYLRSDEPFQGPDGFSYMDISTEQDAQKINIQDFLSWCGQAGVGLVLNLKFNKTPEYVFTYGMLWNYLLRQSFLNIESSKKPKESHPVLVHKILEAYLPRYVRENIKEFLTSNQIEGVKIGLISRGDKTTYELLWYFSNNTDLIEKDQKTLLESLAWFLPLDYKVALIREDDPTLHLKEL